MAERNELLQTTRANINDSIRANTRRGFINWSGCDNICMDMDNMLDRCKLAFEQGRYIEALETAIYLLVAGVRLASRADSSSGMLSFTINESFKLIDLCTQTIAQQDAEMQINAFNLIIRNSKVKAFDGWFSKRYVLLEMAVCLCDDKMASNMEKLLDAFLDQYKKEDRLDYVKNEDIVLRYKLHRHLKGANSVKAELYANLHINELCRLAVQDALAEKDYIEAERLCLQQIGKYTWNIYRTSPDDWNNVLFEVYVASGSIEKQIDQALCILFLGNAAFWDVLKNLYLKQNVWAEQRALLLEALRQSNRVECYRQILIREDEKKLLLESISNDVYDLFAYAGFLVETYPEEIYALCANFIRKQCAEANERRLYKHVCKNIVQLVKWHGDATAKALIDELKERYPRRPALLEELEKVEKKFVNKI